MRMRLKTAFFVGLISFIGFAAGQAEARECNGLLQLQPFDFKRTEAALVAKGKDLSQIRFSEIRCEGGTCGLKIYYGDDEVGSLSSHRFRSPVFSSYSVNLRPDFRGAGLGMLLYLILGRWLYEHEGVELECGAVLLGDGWDTWENLVGMGAASKTSDEEKSGCFKMSGKAMGSPVLEPVDLFYLGHLKK